MFRFFRKLAKHDENRTLSSNILSLGALQIFTYVLPLITLPYLVRVLGIETFGLLSLIAAITAYFVLVSDYGFNLSATKQISDHRENKKKYSQIFYDVMAVKVILVLLSLLLLTILLFLIDSFKENAHLYYLNFGVVIGQALFPVWFFQGMEAMKKIAVINICTKIAFTASIFIFVKSPADYWLVPSLTSIGFILSGAIASFLAIRSFNIAPAKPSWSSLAFQIRSGWDVFLSRIYVNIYTTTNLVLLGLVTNNTVVGIYSVAEKMQQAIGGLFSPINQAFYPFLAKTYRSSPQRFFRIFTLLNCFFLMVSSLMAVAAFYLSEELVTLVAGANNNAGEVIEVFKLLCAAILLAPFGSSFTNAFLVLGKARKVSLIVFLTMTFNCILVFPLIFFYGAAGLALTWVLGQFFHVSLYLYEYRKLVIKVEV